MIAKLERTLSTALQCKDQALPSNKNESNNKHLFNNNSAIALERTVAGGGLNIF